MTLRIIKKQVQDRHGFRLGFGFLLLGLMVGTIPPSQASDARACNSRGDTSQIESIRSQREAFNAAIKSMTIEAIGRILSDDVLLITGTDSDVYKGREAQLDIWRTDKDRPDRAIYKRTTACVQVSPLFPIAMEYGSWRGQQLNDPANFATGSYTAKWRLSGDMWQLEIETYMTEGCGGSFCPTDAVIP